MSDAKKAGFIEDYKLLVKTSTRELWVVYFLKLAESFAFFASLTIMVLFLSADLGMTDLQAGKTYGIWALCWGLLVFFSGTFSDVIGIKKALLLGFIFLTLGRISLAIFSNYHFVLFVGLPLLALGQPLMIPIKSAAIKQYTTKETRALAFAIFYSLMNFALVAAGVILDFVIKFVKLNGVADGEIVMKKGHDVTRYILTVSEGFSFSSYQLIFGVSGITTLAGLLIIILFMRNKSYAEEDIEAGLAGKVPTLQAFGQKIAQAVSKITFWRFMLLLSFVALVKFIFTHMHITVPKFMLREIGPLAIFGKVLALNGLMLMILPPLISNYLKRFSNLSTIVIGTFISAASILFLTVDYSFYAGIVDALPWDFHIVYVPVVTFVFVFSIGEAIWNPKLYEYTANIAPKGQESTYMALSCLPWYLGKFPAAWLSGMLLVNYCPETGERNSQMMWLIIALITFAAPALIIIFRKFITKKDV
jgi:dipeptide/tripeptide permease